MDDTKVNHGCTKFTFAIGGGNSGPGCFREIIRALLPIFSLFGAFFAFFLMESSSI